MPRMLLKSNPFFSGLPRGVNFVRFVARQLYRDHCAQTAASLTYTSLLAFVPFLVVGFSILREFPIFPELLSALQSSILQVFTPDAGDGVKRYIQDIINKDADVPVLSFLVLVITTVMMLYTIDDSLNRIWRVEYKRRTMVSFVMYFVVVISGPLLLGSSLVITTYLISQSWLIDDALEVNWLVSVPWLVTLIAFTALYRWVPNTLVKWRYALSGGVLAMLLFELAKWGFAFYIRWVPTYDLLYGALAAIPLTLIWVYLCWLVVLVGAETARCLAIFSGDCSSAIMSSRKLLNFFLMSDKEGISIEQIRAGLPVSRKKLSVIFSRLQELDLLRYLSDGRVILTDKALTLSIIELTDELAKQLNLIKGHL